MYQQQELIDKVKDELEREIISLQKIEEQLGSLPKGKLVRNHSRGHIYYYHVFESVETGVKMRVPIPMKTEKGKNLKKLLELRKSLEQARRSLITNIKLLRRTEKKFLLIDDPRVHLKGAIDVEEWRNSSYTESTFHMEHKRVMTKNGTLVRSKSEAAIYDELVAFGVLFRYECGFTLITGQTIYPDFIIIREKDGKPFIWEHLGMTYKQENVVAYLKRLVLLGKAGFKLGDNLIVTWDSGEQPFSAENARSTIINSFGLPSKKKRK